MRDDSTGLSEGLGLISLCFIVNELNAVVCLYNQGKEAELLAKVPKISWQKHRALLHYHPLPTPTAHPHPLLARSQMEKPTACFIKLA